MLSVPIYLISKAACNVSTELYWTAYIKLGTCTFMHALSDWGKRKEVASVVISKMCCIKAAY